LHVSGRENSIEEGVEKCQEEKKERTLIQDATLLLFCAGRAHFGKINITLIFLCATSGNIS
jgi:hypothetical protein